LLSPIALFDGYFRQGRENPCRQPKVKSENIPASARSQKYLQDLVNMLNLFKLAEGYDFFW
jgi:hypothetical protein